MERHNKIILTDLDGTLADITHRLRFINPEEGKSKNWDAFYEHCIFDEPKQEIIDLVNKYYDDGYIVRIVSGRSSVVRGTTIKWLERYGVKHDDLLMRDEGSYIPDDVLKETWLKGGMLGDYFNIEFVIDDRKRICEMWRRNGLLCLQVANGNF